MTSGSWSLTTAIRATGALLPSNQPTAARARLSDRIGQALTYGTTSGKADIICFQTRSILTTATLTLDLYTGTDLRDIHGDTAAFRKIKSLVVWVDSGGDTAGVRVGGAGADTWVAFFANTSDKHLIFPSGPPYLGGSPAGVAVGNTTKNLLLENLSAVTAVVGIAIAGTSA
jgi:hypothetical protein